MNLSTRAPHTPFLPSRSAFAAAAVGYALLVLYVSTVLSPLGFNFTPLPIDTAWAQFQTRAFSLMDTGSDQRADWLGNLMMLVPLGFLGMAALTPRDRPSLPAVQASVLLLVGIGSILLVKWAQLFFPPRTVTLNYVMAQSIGLLVGIVLHVPWTRAARRIEARGWHAQDVAHLLLFVHAAVVFVFLLMPLDIALSPEDLAEQVRRFPDTLLRMPASDRSALVQFSVIGGLVLAMAPVGMLLALRRQAKVPGRAVIGAVMAQGLALMIAVYLASCLIMGARPAAISIVPRVIGITGGAALLLWFQACDSDRLAAMLRGIAPWCVVPYLLLLLAVNGLLSTHWLTPAEAWDQAGARGLLPFYNYYIVSKAAAARNVLAHAAMYAPVGLLIWARQGRPTHAALLAGVLAAMVELGRALRPGLQGEHNTILVAAAAAWITAHAAAALWSLGRSAHNPSLLGRSSPGRAAGTPAAIVTPPRPPAPAPLVIGPAARPSGPVPGWRERAEASRRAAAAPRDPPGPVEHY